jgi:membrane protein required for colicin V production
MVSLVYSVLKGMVREIFSFLAYIGGYLMAVNYQNDAIELLGGFIPNPTFTKLISFISIFVLTVVVISTLGWGIRKLIHSTPGLSGMDRFLGGVFGVLKGVVIAVTLLFILGIFPDYQKKALYGSKLAPHLQTARNIFSDTVESQEFKDNIPEIPMENIKGTYNKLKNIGQKYKSIKLDDEGNAADPDAQDDHSDEDKKKLKDILLKADES